MVEVDVARAASLQKQTEGDDVLLLAILGVGLNISRDPAAVRAGGVESSRVHPGFSSFIERHFWGNAGLRRKGLPGTRF
jgi:hypothetical protein